MWSPEAEPNCRLSYQGRGSGTQRSAFSLSKRSYPASSHFPKARLDTCGGLLLVLPLPHPASHLSRRETPVNICKMGKDKCQQTLLKWGPRCVISKAKSAKGKVFLAVTLPGGTLVFTNLTFMMGACLEHPECHGRERLPPPPGALLSLDSALMRKICWSQTPGRGQT